jgi:hypothetical protein
MEKVDVPDWDVVQLDPRTAAVWLQPAIDNTQSNSAIEIYFQLPGRDSWAWNKDIASRCIPSQNMSKHVKTCQNMSKHVKTCQDMSRHVKPRQNMSKGQRKTSKDAKVERCRVNVASQQRLQEGLDTDLLLDSIIVR